MSHAPSRTRSLAENLAARETPVDARTALRHFSLTAEDDPCRWHTNPARSS